MKKFLPVTLSILLPFPLLLTPASASAQSTDYSKSETISVALSEQGATSLQLGDEIDSKHFSTEYTLDSPDAEGPDLINSPEELDKERQMVSTSQEPVAGERPLTTSSDDLLAECLERPDEDFGQDGRLPWVRDRYNSCYRNVVGALVHDDKGNLVSFANLWIATTIQASEDSRKLSVRQHVHDTEIQGAYFLVPEARFEGFCFDAVNPGEIDSCTDSTGIQTRSFYQLQNGQDVTWEVDSPLGAGTGVEEVVVGNFRASVQIIDEYRDAYFDWVSAASGSARFDSASYLGSKFPNHGTVLLSRIPHMELDVLDPEVRENVTHIMDALSVPEDTVPDNPLKNIPGYSPHNPLHRLYHDEERRTDNRGTAIEVCRDNWPNYPDNDQDCDEFPFASTYEGAAQALYEDVPPKNFSARPIDSLDNQKFGSKIGAFYGSQRILDWDENLDNEASVGEWHEGFYLWVN